MKRMGQADETTDAILWLFSDEASFVTGRFIELTGGKYTYRRVLNHTANLEMN